MIYLVIVIFGLIGLMVFQGIIYWKCIRFVCEYKDKVKNGASGGGHASAHKRAMDKWRNGNG